jgi:hypothetical protein
MNEVDDYMHSIFLILINYASLIMVRTSAVERDTLLDDSNSLIQFFTAVTWPILQDVFLLANQARQTRNSRDI